MGRVMVFDEAADWNYGGSTCSKNAFECMFLPVTRHMRLLPHQHGPSSTQSTGRAYVLVPAHTLRPPALCCALLCSALLCAGRHATCNRQTCDVQTCNMRQTNTEHRRDPCSHISRTQSTPCRMPACSRQHTPHTQLHMACFRSSQPSGTHALLPRGLARSMLPTCVVLAPPTLLLCRRANAAYALEGKKKVHRCPFGCVPLRPRAPSMRPR